MSSTAPSPVQMPQPGPVDTNLLINTFLPAFTLRHVDHVAVAAPACWPGDSSAASTCIGSGSRAGCSRCACTLRLSERGSAPAVSQSIDPLRGRFFAHPHCCRAARRPADHPSRTRGPSRLSQLARPPRTSPCEYTGAYTGRKTVLLGLAMPVAHEMMQRRQLHNPKCRAEAFRG